MSAKTIKPTMPDGKASAQELLRTLEKLNWKRDAPVGSRKAAMAAIKAAAALPDHELARFAEVLSVLLTAIVGGHSPNYESQYAKEYYAQREAA